MTLWHLIDDPSVSALCFIVPLFHHKHRKSSEFDMHYWTYVARIFVKVSLSIGTTSDMRYSHMSCSPNSAYPLRIAVVVEV